MYQVDGFIYEAREDARKAKKEADGIAYIREQTRLNNPEVVLKLYNKLLDERIFETEVGIGFLRELQQLLRTSPYMEDKEIRPIPIQGKTDEVRVEQERIAARERTRKRRLQKERKEKNGLKGEGLLGRFWLSLAINIVCVAIIAGMFIITYASGKSTTILNYKNAVIDEYEAWEQDLKNREEELSEWESELSALEEQLMEQQ